MPYKDIQRKNQYQRNWYKTNRDNWLNTFGPCKNCKSTQNLEVDHIDPNQKVSHRIWSWSKIRQTKELSKCQVLCHTCHLQKTKLQRDGVKVTQEPHKL